MKNIIRYFVYEVLVAFFIVFLVLVAKTNFITIQRFSLWLLFLPCVLVGIGCLVYWLENKLKLSLKYPIIQGIFVMFLLFTFSVIIIVGLILFMNSFVYDL